ncbi:MAG: hypothetical protein WBM92_00195 [Aureibaculum sp.]|jgi:hypothetical protein
MLGNLFKQRSHYVFDYKPRYYDERKERLKNLQEKYDKTDTPRINFTKNNLKSQWIRNKRQVTNRNSNIRLAVIIAIIVGLVAYIFQIHTLF